MNRYKMAVLQAGSMSQFAVVIGCPSIHLSQKQWEKQLNYPKIYLVIMHLILLTSITDQASTLQGQI